MAPFHAGWKAIDAVSMEVDGAKAVALLKLLHSYPKLAAAVVIHERNRMKVVNKKKTDSERRLLRAKAVAKVKAEEAKALIGP
ncbi:unnamed protein product, partial [Prorocentrum cordatum]